MKILFLIPTSKPNSASGSTVSREIEFMIQNDGSRRVVTSNQDNPNSPTPPFRPILAILASKQGGGRRHENFGILDFGGRRHEKFSELGISTYLHPAGGENFGDFEPVSRAFPL